jgi:hypothetical protein
VNVAAIATGYLTDTLSTLLFGGIVASIVAGDGASQDEVIARFNDSLGLLLSTFAVGLGFTAVGGYVAAAIAKDRPIRHAAMVGVLSLLTSLSLSLAGPSDGPLWLQLAGYALTVPAAVLGGWFRATPAEGKRA